MHKNALILALSAVLLAATGTVRAAFTVNVPSTIAGYSNPINTIEDAFDYLTDYTYWSGVYGAGLWTSEVVLGGHTILVAATHVENADVTVRDYSLGFDAMTLSNLTLQGQTAGAAQSTINGSVTSPWGIFGFTLDGFVINSASFGVNVAWQCIGWTVSNNIVTAVGEGIIQYREPGPTMILDNVVVAGSNGIRAAGFVNIEVEVSGNTVTTPSSAWGIYLPTCLAGAEVTSNSVYDALYGIHTGGAGSALIAGNDLHDTANSSIFPSGNNNIIRDNSVEGSGSAGIWMYGGGNGWLVENNTIVDCQQGIFIAGDNNTVRGNTITDLYLPSPNNNNYYGVAMLFQAGVDNVFADNTIRRCPGGIYTSLPATRLSVTGNLFSGWTDVAETVRGTGPRLGIPNSLNASDLIIDGNWFTGWNPMHLWVEGNVTGTVSYNVFDSTSFDFIRYRGHAGTVTLSLDHNTFHDGSVGVYAPDSGSDDSADFTNNLMHNYGWTLYAFNAGPTVTSANNLATNTAGDINFSSLTRGAADFLYLSCATPAAVMFGATDGSYLGALPAWCVDECDAATAATLAVACAPAVTTATSVQELLADVTAAAQTPLDGMCANCQDQRAECLATILLPFTP